MADRQEVTPRPSFPPPLERGSRVWTDRGYLQHGPVDGPKQDILGPQGGEVIGIEKPYYTYDHLLYSVRWDNGQTSKHYSKELFSIGRFKTRTEFEAAVKLTGAMKMEVGPRGGFRSVRFRVVYDGETIESETYSRDVWRDVLEPLGKRDGTEVVRVKADGP